MVITGMFWRKVKSMERKQRSRSILSTSRMEKTVKIRLNFVEMFRKFWEAPVTKFYANVVSYNLIYVRNDNALFLDNNGVS